MVREEGCGRVMECDMLRSDVLIPLYGRHFDNVEGTKHFHGSDARTQRLTVIVMVAMIVVMVTG